MLEAGEALRTWAIDAPIVAGSRPAGAGACRPSAGLSRLRGGGLGRAGDGPADRRGDVPASWSGRTRPGPGRARGRSARRRGRACDRSPGRARPADGDLELPPGELGLKHLARGEGRGVGRPPWCGRSGPPGGSGRSRICSSSSCTSSRLEVGRVPDDDDGIAVPRFHWTSTPRSRAYSMIRSRTLSAGTGRIPARIFSRVSSTMFPSGTRGRATTVITDWTPPGRAGRPG